MVYDFSNFQNRFSPNLLFVDLNKITLSRRIVDGEDAHDYCHSVAVGYFSICRLIGLCLFIVLGFFSKVCLNLYL